MLGKLAEWRRLDRDMRGEEIRRRSRFPPGFRLPGFSLPGFRLLRPLQEIPKEALSRYWEADVEDVKFAVQLRLEEGRGVLGARLGAEAVGQKPP